MIYALFNDCIQRIITLNKIEQRRNLLKNLKMLSLESGSKCLDFGCGTGLFAKVFTREQLYYFGYDIDKRLTDYANSLYQSNRCVFTASIGELKKQSPFNLIMANCCFHHIDDIAIHDVLTIINSLLDIRGTFLFIDILLNENDHSILQTVFKKIERGAYIRKAEDYQKFIEKYFTVINDGVERSHLFSIRGIPVYNDLTILVCKKK